MDTGENGAVCMPSVYLTGKTGWVWDNQSHSPRYQTQHIFHSPRTNVPSTLVRLRMNY